MAITSAALTHVNTLLVRASRSLLRARGRVQAGFSGNSHQVGGASPNKSFRKLAPASARAPASPASMLRWLRTPASRAALPTAYSHPHSPVFC